MGNKGTKGAKAGTKALGSLIKDPTNPKLGRKVYELCDLAGNGLLSMEEIAPPLCNALEAIGRSKAEKVLLGQLNTANVSGSKLVEKLLKAQLADAYLDHREEQMYEIHLLFSAHDTAKDGFINFEEFQGLLGGLEDLVKAQTGRYIADMTLRNVGQAGKIEAKARETGRVVKDGSQFRFGYKFNALRKFNKTCDAEGKDWLLQLGFNEEDLRYIINTVNSFLWTYYIVNGVGYDQGENVTRPPWIDKAKDWCYNYNKDPKFAQKDVRLGFDTFSFKYPIQGGETAEFIFFELTLTPKGDFVETTTTTTIHVDYGVPSSIPIGVPPEVSTGIPVGDPSRPSSQPSSSLAPSPTPALSPSPSAPAYDSSYDPPPPSFSAEDPPTSPSSDYDPYQSSNSVSSPPSFYDPYGSSNGPSPSPHSSNPSPAPSLSPSASVPRPSPSSSSAPPPSSQSSPSINLIRASRPAGPAFEGGKAAFTSVPPSHPYPSTASPGASPRGSPNSSPTGSPRGPPPFRQGPPSPNRYGGPPPSSTSAFSAAPSSGPPRSGPPSPMRGGSPSPRSGPPSPRKGPPSQEAPLPSSYRAAPPSPVRSPGPGGPRSPRPPSPSPSYGRPPSPSPYRDAPSPHGASGARPPSPSPYSTGAGPHASGIARPLPSPTRGGEGEGQLASQPPPASPSRRPPPGAFKMPGM